MKQINTPRTDERAGYVNGYEQFVESPIGDLVPAEFARQLERENAELLEKLKNEKIDRSLDGGNETAVINDLKRENARLQMELDASREAEVFREEQNRQLRNELFGIKRRILETVTNDKMSDRGKVLDIQFVLRKEAQP